MALARATPGAEDPHVGKLFKPAAIASLEDFVCQGADDARLGGPGRILNLAVLSAGIT